MRITIDSDLCKGCDICIDFCKKDVFAESKVRNKRGAHVPQAARADACVGCLICEKLCPEMAISVEK